MSDLKSLIGRVIKYLEAKADDVLDAKAYEGHVSVVMKSGQKHKVDLADLPAEEKPEEETPKPATTTTRTRRTRKTTK